MIDHFEFEADGDGLTITHVEELRTGEGFYLGLLAGLTAQTGVFLAVKAYNRFRGDD